MYLLTLQIVEPPRGFGHLFAAQARQKHDVMHHEGRRKDQNRRQPYRSSAGELDAPLNRLTPPSLRKELCRDWLTKRPPTPAIGLKMLLGATKLAATVSTATADPPSVLIPTDVWLPASPPALDPLADVELPPSMLAPPFPSLLANAVFKSSAGPCSSALTTSALMRRAPRAYAMNPRTDGWCY